MVEIHFGIALTKSIMASEPDGDRINFGYVITVAQKKVNSVIRIVTVLEMLFKNFDFSLPSMVE